MPWESRIANPVTRRIVLAAVMIGLLICSTAAALLLARRPIFVDWQVERFGSLELRRPATWRLMPRQNNQSADLLAVMDLPGLAQTPLKVFRFRSDRSVPPHVGMQMLKQYMAGARIIGEQNFRDGIVVGRWARAFSMLRLGRLQATTYYVLADVTLDGQTHLLFFLAGPRPASSRQVRMLLGMAGSLRDSRVTSAGRSVDLGEATFDVPAGLTSFRSADQSFTGAYELIADGTGPWRSAGFMRLSPRRIDLQDVVNRAAEGLTAPPPEINDPDRLIAELLSGAYQQATGQAPSSKDYTVSQVAGKTVHEIILHQGRDDPLYQAVWVVRGPQRIAVKIDMVADPQDRTAVEAAARQIVDRLHWTSAAVAPPEKTS